MIIVKKRLLNELDKAQILALWSLEYPAKLVYDSIEDFDLYLKSLPLSNHYLLENDKAKVVGWASTFYRNKEIWFTLILAAHEQGLGWGTKLLDILKENESILCGWVIDRADQLKANGMYYRSPLDFYKKNGFIVFPEIRLEADGISAVKIKWMRALPNG